MGTHAISRPLHWMCLALVAACLLTAAAAPSGALPAGDGLNATAALGTVVTATLTLDNTGQPAATVQLYEAWPAPAASAAAAASPLRVPLPQETGPIAAELAHTFDAAPAAKTDMLIYLADQADLSAAAAIKDWNARGEAVVRVLREHAERTQAPLLAEMTARGYAPRPYWIVNAIAVTGDAALAQWAAGQSAVALVTTSKTHTLDVDVAQAAQGGGVAWGVAQIGAPAVWADWGVRGEGIVVANIDTGVMFSHTALLTAYRGWSPGGVQHDYNWYDAASDPPHAVPFDNNGHGTHTMGTLVGGGAGGFEALGVAPGARWIAARGCSGIFCNDEALIASAQWILAPTNLAGGLPRPDLRPHIVNNSWGKTGADDWYTGYVTAWNAAGIFAVFAAGNNGSLFGCASTISPGNYADAFSVGATDANDVVADFSSRGPALGGLMKPDVAAPGVAVPSTWHNGGVMLLNGTSMATPHVAGLAALLWSSNPSLIGEVDATRALLTSTAMPREAGECTPELGVPNNVYGWGRVDARQAVQAARVEVPWLSVPPTATLPAGGAAEVEVVFDARQVSATGTYTARILVARGNNLSAVPVTLEVEPGGDIGVVTGRLVDAWTGTGVIGRVEVGSGPRVQTDAAGYYTVTLPHGGYTFEALATGYNGASANLNVPMAEPADFMLTADLPHVAWSAGATTASLPFAGEASLTIKVENQGTQPLSVTASVPGLEWLVQTKGAGASSLFDLSALPAISLKDDEVLGQPLPLGFNLPLFGRLVDEIYLSSNGWISIEGSSKAEPWSACEPGDRLPRGTLAAFWADLDPSQGGAVRAGAVGEDTFVVSFEAVPHWQEVPSPDSPRYTFQIALHADGRVHFIYGDMGPLPARWSVGAFYDQTRSQPIACYKSPAELAWHVWTLTNQPVPSAWLAVNPSTLTVPPGGSAELSAELRGFGYSPWHPQPYTGVVRLTTNDPSQKVIDVPVSAFIAAAPYATYLPRVLR